MDNGGYELCHQDRVRVLQESQKFGLLVTKIHNIQSWYHLARVFGCIFHCLGILAEPEKEHFTVHEDERDRDENDGADYSSPVEVDSA